MGLELSALNGVLVSTNLFAGMVQSVLTSFPGFMGPVLSIPGDDIRLSINSALIQSGATTDPKHLDAVYYRILAHRIIIRSLPIPQSIAQQFTQDQVALNFAFTSASATAPLHEVDYGGFLKQYQFDMKTYCDYALTYSQIPNCLFVGFK